MIVLSNKLVVAAWLTALTLGVGLSPAGVYAGIAASPAQDEADDEGTDSLDEELLKDLEDTPSAKKNPAAEKVPASKPDSVQPADTADDKAERKPGDRATDSLDEELLRELGEGDEQSADEADPLDRVARTMREVENRLTRSKSGEETREMQTKIVADLDKMIEEALKEAKRSKSKSASSSNDQQARRSKPDQAQQGDGKQQAEQQSDKPASDSTEQLGADRALRPDPGQVRDMMKHLWGHLPEREREMMLNASIEQFLPKYELLIEQYFRRLAEEQQPK